jgi:hypothetical protein
MPASQFHPSQQLISPRGEPADIDVELVPLIRALWRRGFDTASCCQDLGESNAATDYPPPRRWVDYHRGFACIDLPIPDGIAALAAVADAGPRDEFYERMTHWRTGGAWSVHVPVLDLNCGAVDGPVRSAFEMFGIQVVFPRSDIAEFTRRLDRARMPLRAG